MNRGRTRSTVRDKGKRVLTRVRVRCLADVIKFEIDYTGFVGSLQMDQPCFLLRAYVPRHAVERREACAPTCHVFIPVGYLCSRFREVPFRAMCSVYRVSVFALSCSPSLISIPLPFAIITRYSTHDPVLAIITMGFLSTRIITGSSSRITL